MQQQFGEVGLAPIGVLGILLRARLTGNLGSLKVAMQNLQKHAGFYIASDLFNDLLRAAGE